MIDWNQTLQRAMIAAVLALATLAACVSESHAEEWYSSKDHHPWGRFQVGSWKRVRLTTDQLRDGKVVATNTTEITTTLVKANATCYTLRVDVATRIGRGFRCSQPRYVLRYYGPELEGKVLGDLVLHNDTVKFGMGDRKHALKSEVRQITYSKQGWKRTSRIHFSPTQAPFVLRRETTSSDDKGNKVYQTSVSTSDVNLLKEINGVRQKVSTVLIEHEQNSQKTITNETQSLDVPGFVVASESKVLNTDNDTELRRSHLELIDFHIGQGNVQFNNYGKRGLRHRRLERRSRRSR